MTETQFREMHSQVIEYYQCIEIHLKGICASLLAENERDWFPLLANSEADRLGKVIEKIRTLQNQRHVDVFSSEEYDALHEIRKKRNWWVHQCFIDYTHVSFSKGVVKHPHHAEMITLDLQDAKGWDEKIVEIGRSLTGGNLTVSKQ